jgi:hypothetical protein
MVGRYADATGHIRLLLKDDNIIIQQETISYTYLYCVLFLLHSSDYCGNVLLLSEALNLRRGGGRGNSMRGALFCEGQRAPLR